MRIHVPLRLRWSDLDAYGHVNSVSMLTLLEEARIDVFWNGGAVHVGAALNAAPQSGNHPETFTLIAHQEAEYHQSIPYHRDPLDVELWVSAIGGASLEISYEVFSPISFEPRTKYASARTVTVLVDGNTNQPRRISNQERAQWSVYLEKPVVFRNR